MKTWIVPGLAGAVFGVGLVLSGMTRPDKVVAFLDVTGDWDPSLGFVMGAAVLVHLVAYRLVPRMPHPLLGGRWSLPTRKDIDVRLLAGAALFGAGWGIGGFCPGPALTSLVSGRLDVLLFFGAMVTGMALFQVVDRAWLSVPSAVPAAPPAPAPTQPIVGVFEAATALEAGTVLLDVRTRTEFAAGHAPGALNLPIDELARRTADVEHLKGAQLLVICRSGRRSALAVARLRADGFDAVDVRGGTTAWEAAGLPTVRDPGPNLRLAD